MLYLQGEVVGCPLVVKMVVLGYFPEVRMWLEGLGVSQLGVVGVGAEWVEVKEQDPHVLS